MQFHLRNGQHRRCLLEKLQEILKYSKCSIFPDLFLKNTFYEQLSKLLLWDTETGKKKSTTKKC